MVEEFIDALERHFVAHADPTRAEPMANYMRDQFPFFGIGAQDRRTIFTAVAAEYPLPEDVAEVADLVDGLLARAEREWHYSAVSVLRAQRRRLNGHYWDCVHTVATTHPWWDTIDELAKHVAGRIVSNHPEQVAAMDRWVQSDDMWVARVALLHQLGFKSATDSDRLFRYCELRADETDFFYRKAIGWALRQYGYVDPDAVRAFVARNEQQLSTLTQREALKNIG